MLAGIPPLVVNEAGNRGMPAELPPALLPWLKRWRLQVDGAAFTTRMGSHLMPVLSQGRPAMLKIATSAEERRGAAVMRWWNGRGAARVYASRGPAVLLERALGARSLSQMAISGADSEAMSVLCRTVRCLHERQGAPAPNLVPLPLWFDALAGTAPQRGGIFLRALAAWRLLARSDGASVVLHGDIHHDNVLDGGARGWLAIDPKGLIGDRGFDYVNMLCNPWFAGAAAPPRLEARIGIVSQAADIEPRRLLLWLLAWAGLSASWTLADRGDASRALAMADLAEAALRR